MPDPSMLPDDSFGKVAAAFVAALVTGPLAVTATWLTSRRAQKANIETMIVNAAGGLVQRLEAECLRVSKECTAMRAEIEHLRHALKTDRAECDEQLQELRDEIARLMANPLNAAIPAYGAADIEQGQRTVRGAMKRQANTEEPK